MIPIPGSSRPLSWGHDREKGGECHRGEYEYCGNRYTSISYGIFMFLWENTFITPLLIASLHYIIDDVIVTS